HAAVLGLHVSARRPVLASAVVVSEDPCRTRAAISGGGRQLGQRAVAGGRGRRRGFVAAPAALGTAAAGRGSPGVALCRRGDAAFSLRRPRQVYSVLGALGGAADR